MINGEMYDRLTEVQGQAQDYAHYAVLDLKSTTPCVENILQSCLKYTPLEMAVFCDYAMACMLTQESAHSMLTELCNRLARRMGE